MRNRTVCVNYYNMKRRRNKDIQPSVDLPSWDNELYSEPDISNNNRSFIVGPLFSGKTQLLLKFISRIPHRDICILIKLPPEHCSKYKFQVKERGEKIKPLNEYDNSVIVFDNNLGSARSKFKNQFFLKGWHIILDICYLSQSHFDLPKRTIRKNSNKINLFNHILKDIGIIYRDVDDKSCDEIKDLCRKCREEDFKCLLIGRSKKKNEGRYCNCKWSKIIYIECTPETNTF